MKTVSLRYFASVREAVGTAVETVQTEAVSVNALRDELIARGGAWAEALARGSRVRAALDQAMVHEAEADAPALADGCEVAFFPPVTGG